MYAVCALTVSYCALASYVFWKMPPFTYPAYSDTRPIASLVQWWGVPAGEVARRFALMLHLAPMLFLGVAANESLNLARALMGWADWTSPWIVVLDAVKRQVRASAARPPLARCSPRPRRPTVDAARSRAVLTRGHVSQAAIEAEDDDEDDDDREPRTAAHHMFRAGTLGVTASSQAGLPPGMHRRDSANFSGHDIEEAMVRAGAGAVGPGVAGGGDGTGIWPAPPGLDPAAYRPAPAPLDGTRESYGHLPPPAGPMSPMSPKSPSEILARHSLESARSADGQMDPPMWAPIFVPVPGVADPTARRPKVLDEIDETETDFPDEATIERPQEVDGEEYEGEGEGQAPREPIRRQRTMGRRAFSFKGRMTATPHL